MIIKNGEVIAIDVVEHDENFSGTGREGDPLVLREPGKTYTGIDPIEVDNDKNTIGVNKTWKTEVDETVSVWSKIDSEKVTAWAKVPVPPMEVDNELYVMKNKSWTKLDLSTKADKVHKHNIEEINELDDCIAGIYTEIDNKADKEHSHKFAGNVVTGDGSTKSPWTISKFSGTNGTTTGKDGLVPAPAISDKNKFLSSSGTWEALPESGKTIVDGKHSTVEEKSDGTIAINIDISPEFNKTNGSLNFNL